MFTVRYPFGSTEPFVRTDLDAMVEQFGTVEVVPALGARGLESLEARARPVPSGVVVNCSLASRPLRPPASFDALRDAILLGGSEAMALLRRPQAAINPGTLYRSGGSALRALRTAAWLRERFGASRSGLPVPAHALVVAYWANSEAVGTALVRRERGDLRFACRVHRGDVERAQQAGGHLPHRRVLYQAVDLVGAISQRARMLVLEEGVDAAHVAVHRLGTRAIGDSDVVCGAVTPDATITIASCSSSAPVKRVGLIAAGTAAFARREPERRVRWMHVGLDRDALAAACMRDGVHIDALPLNLQIHATGYMPNERLIAWYRDERVACFINASSSEGVPVSVMEALGVGVPVVATDAGATAEIVDDRVGRLLPVDTDAEAIAAAIADVVHRHAAFSSAARERWRGRCRASEHAREWVDALAQLVD